MTGNDIREHFLLHSPWVDRDNTVDTFKAGDPDAEVGKVGVGWMATIYDLKAAHAAGCSLFITHEPTFNGHRDPAEEQGQLSEPGITKAAFLKGTGLVVLRLHDTWDAWPGLGIRDSWAGGLGLTRFVGENTSGPQLRWHAAYDIDPVPLADFACQVAQRVAVLGQDGVDVMGDPERLVTRAAVGVGCGCPDKDMVDIGADVLIMCYDGAPYWAVRERLAELGVALITVEHGTSEMWGMESLAGYLAETFPDLEVQNFAEHPRVWHVSG